MTMLIYIFLRRKLIELDIATAREDRGQLEYSGSVYRMYILGSCFAPVSVTIWSGLRRKSLPFFAAPGVILLLAFAASVVSGVRFEMVPLVAMLAVGMVINNLHHLVINSFRTL